MWTVIKARRTTGRIVETRAFPSEAEAQKFADDFNRWSQDRTWDATEARVEFTPHPARRH
jgi:hypothetical protein